MRGAVPADNYANLNVCYIGRFKAIIDFNVWFRLEMTHCNFGK